MYEYFVNFMEKKLGWSRVAIGSVTPYCLAVHLPAGVITTGPWEECFTPWTMRLHSRLAYDLLGTIPFCCFLNWPRFLPLPSSPLPLSPPLLWSCQYLVVCAGPRKTHLCTSKLYWPPETRHPPVIITLALMGESCVHSPLMYSLLAKGGVRSNHDF